MDFLSATNIHFTGLKGVGMTALALIAQDLKVKVSGSDVDDVFVTGPILKTRRLKAKIGFSPDHIPPKTDLLVYNAAHQGSNNPEVKAAQHRNIPVLSHAQALGQAMQGKLGVSVCGVGGKTTTASMLSHILNRLNAHPSFCIGVGNIRSLKAPGRYDHQGKHFVAEADEYLGRFMYQTPRVIICTNIEFDHPDVYQNLDQTKAAFLHFFNRLPQDGLLLISANSATNREVISQLKVNYQTYTRDPNLKLNLPGDFNQANATAAVAAAGFLGFDKTKAAATLKDFTGTHRRFEKIAAITDNLLLYDDYAHHPKEISATLQAAKAYFPGHQIVAIFQPHTYSRTQALFSEFASSFTAADKVVFLPIYASARETPDPAISSLKLSQATPGSAFAPDTPNLLQYLKANLTPPAVIFTLGAGDIFLLHDQIITSLTS